MNDTQLALSIGIPSLLVILSWIHNNTRLNRLEAAYDNTNRRIDDTNGRIDRLTQSIHADMNSLRDSIHSDMVGLHERLATVEARQS